MFSRALYRLTSALIGFYDLLYDSRTCKTAILKIFLGVDISYQKRIRKNQSAIKFKQSASVPCSNPRFVLFCSDVGLFCMPKWSMKELAIM